MAILDKLKFWQKKEEIPVLDKELGKIGEMPLPPGAEAEHPFGLETGYGAPFSDQLSISRDLGLGEEKQGFQPFGMEPAKEESFLRSSYPATAQQQPLQQPQPVYPTKDVSTQLDLVTEKLETIKVSLEGINHRLLAVERALRIREEETQRARVRRGVW
jgi:hypothetical protein